MRSSFLLLFVEELKGNASGTPFDQLQICQTMFLANHAKERKVSVRSIFEWKEREGTTPNKYCQKIDHGKMLRGNETETEDSIRHRQHDT